MHQVLNCNISSHTPTVYHSHACGIEDQDDKTMVISGGLDDDGVTARVTKYKNNGDAQDLPTLNEKRQNHGCGFYKNTNNEKVRIIVICAESL